MQIAMMRGIIKRAATTPHRINNGRRQLLFGTFAGVAGIAILPHVEQAYTAVATVVSLGDRKKRANVSTGFTPANIQPIGEVTHGNQLPGSDLNVPVSLDSSTIYSSKMQRQDAQNNQSPQRDLLAPADVTLNVRSTPKVDPTSVQNSPTPDATVAEAQKDLILQQDKQAQNENNWYWPTNIAAPLGTVGAVGTLLAVGVGYIQFRRSQRIERDKQDEDRFQTVVAGLGSKDIEAKTGAAVMLRTFLDPKGKKHYQRFYQQIFDLAVAHLRLREVDPKKPEPDSLNQALIRVFLESMPLVRETLQVPIKFRKYNPFLDASNIRLDGGFLKNADLKYVWLREASLIGANFSEANLAGANLKRANLKRADLGEVDLSETNLKDADLSGAKLKDANFSEAELDRANLSGADLEGANPEVALSLENTNMQNVFGYDDPEKRKKCNAKGAIFYSPDRTAPRKSNE
jgi:hypothetical protein